MVAEGQTLAFTAWHTYKFDGAKCLVPKKKEWFRVLLTVRAMTALPADGWPPRTTTFGLTAVDARRMQSRAVDVGSGVGL